MSLPRQLALFLSVAVGTFLGCDGEPAIAITTALPINYPTATIKSLMQSMCEPVRGRDEEHVKVHWLKPWPRRGVVFTRTYFCSDVLKEDFKALP
jgi:hypothetical protein